MLKFSIPLLFILSSTTFAFEQAQNDEQESDTTLKTFSYDPEENKKIVEKAKQCIASIKDSGLTNLNKKQIVRYCEVKAWAEIAKPGRFAMRIVNEKATELNPFVITPHKHSYIMPVTYTDNFNSNPYQFIDEAVNNETDYTDNMESVEAKYQISFKIPLTENDFLMPGDALYFGMTVQAWWQLYSDEISKPFRETNYQPEIFYIAPLPWKPFGGNMGFEVSFEHQSNGQSQFLSRSWNRLLVNFIYEKNDFFIGFRPWHRFKENAKTDPLQPKGDDNPDIDDYLGNYEINGAYAFSNEQKLAFHIRKNWKTGNGSIELNLTTPLWGRLLGLVQYFNGYGESLIDYNHKQQKIGIGIALTEIF